MLGKVCGQGVSQEEENVEGQNRRSGGMMERKNESGRE